MATLTISLSDEEMRRLEVLGKREGLTVEQMVRLGINDFIGQPDDAFHAAAKRVYGEKCRALSASFIAHQLITLLAASASAHIVCVAL